MKIFRGKPYTLVSPSKYTMSAKVVTHYKHKGRTFVLFAVDHRTPVARANLRVVSRRISEG